MKNKFTVADCESLKRLDTTLYKGEPTMIDTPFGTASVRKALTPGYIAEHGEGDIPAAFAYGPTPAIALLNLCESFERDREAAVADNVLIFERSA